MWVLSENGGSGSSVHRGQGWDAEGARSKPCWYYRGTLEQGSKPQYSQIGPCSWARLQHPPQVRSHVTQVMPLRAQTFHTCLCLWWDIRRFYKCIITINGPQGTGECLLGPAAHHESSSLYTIKQDEPALITAAYGAHLWNDEVPWTAGHWLQLLLGNQRTDPPQIAHRVYWSTD